MFKLFSILLIVILLIALEIGFLPGFSSNLNLLINLPLLFVLLLVFFADFETAFIGALLSGFFLDLYSPFFFGFFTLLFLIELLVINFFISHVLQNKRLRSLLALNLIALIVWQSIYSLVVFISYKLSEAAIGPVFASPHLSYFFYSLTIHSLLLLFLYRLLPRFKSDLQGSLVA